LGLGFLLALKYVIDQKMKARQAARQTVAPTIDNGSERAL
jgi:electron transport complex protein RnfE